MSTIIPTLLPKTKLFGIYGPGFNYSLAGPQLMNPVLISSKGSNITFQIKLVIRLLTNAPNYNQALQLNMILSTTQGVYFFSQYYYGSLSTPCGSLTFPHSFAVNAGGLPVIELDIFEALRNYIDINYIDLSVNYVTYNPIYSAPVLEVFWNGYAGFGDADVERLQIPYSADSTVPLGSCPTSLGPNKKRITLNKSTGFVLTVT